MMLSHASYALAKKWQFLSHDPLKDGAFAQPQNLGGVPVSHGIGAGQWDTRPAESPYFGDLGPRDTAC